jgi:hypothetical protein
VPAGNSAALPHTREVPGSTPPAPIYHPRWAAPGPVSLRPKRGDSRIPGRDRRPGATSARVSSAAALEARSSQRQELHVWVVESKEFVDIPRGHRLKASPDEVNVRRHVCQILVGRRSSASAPGALPVPVSAASAKLPRSSPPRSKVPTRSLSAKCLRRGIPPPAQPDVPPGLVAHPSRPIPCLRWPPAVCTRPD